MTPHVLTAARRSTRRWVSALRVARGTLANTAAHTFGAAPPLPPPGLRFMGEDDAGFRRIGDELITDLTGLAGMTEDATVLDIGSGYGRVAHALLRAGAFKGRYLGFDILPRHVAWCQRHLSLVARPSIQFRHLDVYNVRYNPKGQLRSEELVIPAPTHSQDVVLLSSVFTHMFPVEVLRYLSEIRRVLKPSGRVLASFFLYGIDGFDGVRPETAYPLRHPVSAFARTAKVEDPLFAIGYDWGWLSARLGELGLVTTQPPLLGAWAGQRPGAGRWQDFLVLARAGA